LQGGAAPHGLEYADVLGARVTKIIGNELLFGEVLEVCGLSRESRRLDQRVRELLEQPPGSCSFSSVDECGARYLENARVASAVEKYEEVCKEWHMNAANWSSNWCSHTQTARSPFLAFHAESQVELTHWAVIVRRLLKTRPNLLKASFFQTSLVNC